MTLFRDIPAFPISPTDPQGRLEAQGLDRLVAARVDTIGLLGSTGGYA